MFGYDMDRKPQRRIRTTLRISGFIGTKSAKSAELGFPPWACETRSVLSSKGLGSPDLWAQLLVKSFGNRRTPYGQNVLLEEFRTSTEMGAQNVRARGPHVFSLPLHLPGFNFVTFFLSHTQM